MAVKRQETTAVCNYTPANWEFNADGDTSCKLWAELGAICTPGFTVSAITPATAPYLPPSGNDDNECQCNIVAYNLMAACGWCQNDIQIEMWLTIDQWAGNCTATTFDATGIPSSVDAEPLGIPEWALAVPTGDTWIPADAEALASSSLSSASTSPTATGGTTSTRRSSSSSRALFTSPPTNSDQLEAIGGVVSGVKIALGVIFGLLAFIYISVAIVFWLRQKKRKQWYNQIASYYKSGGGGAVAAPLLHSMEPTSYTPYPSQANPSVYNYNPHASYHPGVYQLPPPGSEGQYQPPTQGGPVGYAQPMDGSNPFATPNQSYPPSHYTPTEHSHGTPVGYPPLPTGTPGPPPHGQYPSGYAPPPPPGAAGPGGYRGAAEVY